MFQQHNKISNSAAIWTLFKRAKHNKVLAKGHGVYQCTQLTVFKAGNWFS